MCYLFDVLKMFSCKHLRKRKDNDNNLNFELHNPKVVVKNHDKICLFLSQL